MALTTNIVAYYKMEGNSNDSVSTNNGTDTSMSYNLTFGKILQGASFNGSTSMVAIPSGIYGLATGNSAYSINAWVYFTVAPSGGGEITICNITANAAQNFQRWTSYFHIVDAGGAGFPKLAFYRGNGSGTITGNIAGTTTLSVNTYYMVTLTYDGNNMTLYVNGVSDATGTDTTSAASATSGQLGMSSNNGTMINKYTGYMDEVGWWSRALSGAEITQLYNGGMGLTYPFITATFKTWDGVALADIKTIDGIA